ncbi:hypothetical protein EBR21_05465, partial [bacterium]|nr:hypothetical protein [bacterium]
GDDDANELRCLCKIARLVEGQVSGFGVRIVQISPEQRVVLEQFIAKHGSPDNFVPYSGGQKPPADEKNQDVVPPPPPGNADSNEIGQDTTPAQLATSA